MLLARLVPMGSPRYERLAEKFKSFDKIIEWLPIQLFAIWTIFVAGMAAGKTQLDRYYFWDWSDWLIGLIGIIVITTIMNILISRFNGMAFKDENISLKSRVYFVFSSMIIFFIGLVITNGFGNISSIIFYLLPIIAIYLIYTININDSDLLIPDEANKYVKTMGALLLLIIAILLGIYIDDPVLSTGSIVIIPFLIILLFGKHARHLERAKFYPIFIFAMFVVSREAWFIAPLLLLFFVLRSYNYLRYQKVVPTFGVSHESESN